jgi:hypothetical protein
MKTGNWMILAVLLCMLAGAVLIGYDVWKTTSDVPISENGYLAMGLGAALSLMIGCGLMGLLLYRSRHGSDEPPHENNRLHRK